MAAVTNLEILCTEVKLRRYGFCGAMKAQEWGAISSSCTPKKPLLWPQSSYNQLCCHLHCIPAALRLTLCPWLDCRGNRCAVCHTILDFVRVNLFVFLPFWTWTSAETGDFIGLMYISVIICWHWGPARYLFPSHMNCFFKCLSFCCRWCTLCQNLYCHWSLSSSGQPSRGTSVDP